MLNRRSFLATTAGSALLPHLPTWLPLPDQPPAATPVPLDREVLWYASRCYSCGSEHTILAPRGRHADGTPFMYICEFCKWHCTFDSVVLPMPPDFNPGPGWTLWPLLTHLTALGLQSSPRA